MNEEKNKSPKQRGPDGMKWRLSSDGQFDVRSYYDAIRGTRAVTHFLGNVFGEHRLQRG